MIRAGAELLFDGCWERESVFFNNKRASENWWRDRKGIGGQRMDYEFEPNTLYACLNTSNFFKKRNKAKWFLDLSSEICGIWQNISPLSVSLCIIVKNNATNI